MFQEKMIRDDISPRAVFHDEKRSHLFKSGASKKDGKPSNRLESIRIHPRRLALCQRELSTNNHVSTIPWKRFVHVPGTYCHWQLCKFTRNIKTAHDKDKWHTMSQRSAYLFRRNAGCIRQGWECERYKRPSKTTCCNVSNEKHSTQSRAENVANSVSLQAEKPSFEHSWAFKTHKICLDVRMRVNAHAHVRMHTQMRVLK